MKKQYKYWFILLVFVYVPIYSQGSEDYEEAIYAVKYARYSMDYFVYAKDDSVYLPLQDLMGFLRIYSELKENRQISGYVNTNDFSFEWNFGEGTAMNIKGEKIQLQEGTWFSDDIMYFVRTDVLAKVFGFETRTISSDLVVYIKSEEELPLLREAKLNQRQKSFKGYEDGTDKELSPVRYSREYKIINGGIMDYNLSANHSNAGNYFTGTANLGMELLGGEFMFNNLFAYSQNNITNTESYRYENNYRLRYQFENKYVTNIGVGNISTMSTRAGSTRGYRPKNYTLLGAQISNEQMLMPTSFTTRILEKQIKPDWRVELYLNNELFEIQTTDLNGFYRFEIPVDYGNTNVSIKMYGPKGEFIAEEQIINVPNELLPPGTVRYSLNAGRSIQDSVWVSNGNTSVGLTDWLTTSISATNVDLSRDFELVSQSAFKATNSLTLTATITNKGLYQGALKIISPKLGNIDFVYATYDKSFKKNRSEANHEFSLYGYFSNIFSIPLNLRYQGSREQYGNYSYNKLGLDFSMYLKGINLTYRHDIRAKETGGDFEKPIHTSNVQLRYSLNNRRGIFKWIGGLRLSAASNIDVFTGEIYDINASIDQRITSHINITYNYSRTFESGADRFDLSLNMNLPYFRSKSNATLDEHRNLSYGTDISGALEFDSYNLRFNMLNSLGGGYYGKASAVIRFFIDSNGNDKYDAGEEIIHDADFAITNYSAKKVKKKNFILLSDLMPGKRYNLRVKLESFSNPVLLPKYKEFSFVTDPYSYKNIDIRCQAVGMIEGSVSISDTSGTRGQAGVKVVIKNKETQEITEVPVFSDGSFYYLGLVPGDYELQIDSMQCAILKVKSDPAVMDLTIKPSTDGEFIGDVNFNLTKETLVTEPTYSETKLLTPQDTEDKYNMQIPVSKYVYLYEAFKYQTPHTITLSAEMECFMDSVAIYLQEHYEFNVFVIVYPNKEIDEEDRLSNKKERIANVLKYLKMINVPQNRIRVISTIKKDEFEENTDVEIYVQ